MLVICIKCFYFQLAWKADFVLWQCFLCNMVPILLGTGHYLCRGRWGGGVRGGEGNKKGGVKAISDYQDWGAKLSYKEV